MVQKPEPASTLLRGTIVKFLQGKIARQRTILQLAREAMPAPLAAHCLDCLEKDRLLIIFADSPAWTSQLRFYVPQILSKLNASGDFDFQKMQARVLRIDPPPGRRTRPVNTPSADTVRMLRDNSANQASDDLAQALARLAATLENRTARK